MRGGLRVEVGVVGQELGGEGFVSEVQARGAG